MPSWLIALIFIGLVTACGTGATGIGGGGGSGGSDSLHIVSELTGVVQTDGTTAPGSVLAGDIDEGLPGVNSRGLYTFDLTTIPAGKTIRTAKLKVVQSEVAGAPFTDLGSLVVDHLVFGNTMDSADFNLASLSSAFGVISEDPASGSRLVNVFQEVKADLAAGRTISQFRVRFSLRDGDADDVDDNATLNDLGDPPAIIILTFN